MTARVPPFVRLAALLLALSLAPLAAAGARSHQPPPPGVVGVETTLKISDLQVTAAGDGATISWTTDRPASTTVLVGRTTGYEETPAFVDGLTTSHRVRLDGLSGGARYYVRAVSTDAQGETASAGASFVTGGAPAPGVQATPQTGGAPDTPPSLLDAGPTIEVWQGDLQPLGRRGNTQRWVNIQGRVTGNLSFPAGGLTDPAWPLKYYVNGNGPFPAGVGVNRNNDGVEDGRGHPEGRRLYREGDFNLELDTLPPRRPSSPLTGDNIVTIVATDSDGDVTTKMVTIRAFGKGASGGDYLPLVQPLPWGIVWSQAGSVNDVAHVVDGNWGIENGRLRLRFNPTLGKREIGYDRVVAIGSEAWTDYEVTVPITIHGYNEPDGFTAPSNGPGVGLVLRWLGHRTWDQSQPRYGYYPIGAIGWYNYVPSKGKFELNVFWGNSAVASEPTGRSLQIGVPYIFKMRVESRAGDTSRYRLKVWQEGTAEPATWDIDTTAVPTTELKNGSLLLLAHEADASFGNVQIWPLDGTFTSSFMPGVRR